MSEESNHNPPVNLPRGSILIFDGAMGTMLMRQTQSRYPCESLNLTSPESIAAVHQAYVRAGAQVIRTNTFGANRLNLGIFGIAHQVVTINKRAVELAKDAAAHAIGSRTVIVAGSIGPVSQQALTSRSATCTPREAYTQQAQALIEAGVDMLICETFQHTSDIEALLGAILPLAKTGGRSIPVALCITPDDNSKQTAEFAVPLFESIVRDSGVDFFGLNCGSGPESVIRPILEIGKCIGIPLLALPSAGIPFVEGESLRYPIGIDEFCSGLLPLADTGLVAGIGGCCGTTPDYIAALTTSIRK